MARAIFKVLFAVIKGIANVFLMPVNLVVSTAFPSFTTMIARFNVGISNYVGGALGWFSNLLPPYTKQFILLYLSVLLIYYTISITVHLIMKVIYIIKAIKIW